MKFLSWSEAGVWTVQLARFYISLKAGRYKPLFSERNGYYVCRIPLGLGWRILVLRRP